MGKEIVKYRKHKESQADKPKEEHRIIKHIIIKLTKIKDKDKILKATREDDK